MDKSGKQIEHYSILHKIGKGGMADVYLARSNRNHDQRTYAIKFLRTSFIPEEELIIKLQRFALEAKILDQFDHENIIKKVDLGDFDGAPYLVMPYYGGGTLADKLNTEIKFSWVQALELIVPIVDAVAYAHEKGIIHRDIKPSNILLEENGQIVISDFGIAKDKEFGSLSETMMTLTKQGAMLGSPNYMAPEQWIGKAEYSSDQYSVGIIMYQLISGQLPFKAKTFHELYHQILTSPIPQLINIDPNIPIEITNIVSKMVMKDPDDRYPNLREAQREIKSVLDQYYTKLSQLRSSLIGLIDQHSAQLIQKRQELVFLINEYNVQREIILSEPAPNKDDGSKVIFLNDHKYLIKDLIYQTQNSDVYSGWDPLLKRKILVHSMDMNELKADWAIEHLREFFRENMSKIVKIEHHNLDKILEFGEYDHHLIYITRYLDGRPLFPGNSNLMDWQEAFQIMLPVIDAAAFAGENGFSLPNDYSLIDPRNIWICTNNVPIIHDFNIGYSTLTHQISEIDTIEIPRRIIVSDYFTKHDDEFRLVGTMIYKLITGEYPFNHPPINQNNILSVRNFLIYGEFQQTDKLPENLPLDVRIFIIKLLDPYRIGFREIGLRDLQAEMHKLIPDFSYPNTLSRKKNDTSNKVESDHSQRPDIMDPDEETSTTLITEVPTLTENHIQALPAVPKVENQSEVVEIPIKWNENNGLLFFFGSLFILGQLFLDHTQHFFIGGGIGFIGLLLLNAYAIEHGQVRRTKIDLFFDPLITLYYLAVYLIVFRVYNFPLIAIKWYFNISAFIQKLFS